VPLGLAISLYVFVAIMLSVGYAIITAGTYCMYCMCITCMCNTCMYCTCLQYVYTKQNDSTSSQPHSLLPSPPHTPSYRRAATSVGPYREDDEHGGRGVPQPSAETAVRS
jgi:hypothetical protein